MVKGDTCLNGAIMIHDTFFLLPELVTIYYAKSTFFNHHLWSVSETMNQT